MVHRMVRRIILCWLSILVNKWGYAAIPSRQDRPTVSYSQFVIDWSLYYNLRRTLFKSWHVPQFSLEGSSSMPMGMTACFLEAVLPTIIKTNNDILFSKDTPYPANNINTRLTNPPAQYEAALQLNSTAYDPALLRWGFPTITFPSTSISPYSDIAVPNIDTTSIYSSGFSGEPCNTTRPSVLLTLCFATKSALTKFAMEIDLGNHSTELCHCHSDL